MRAAGHYHTGRALDTLATLPQVARLIAEEQPSHVVIYGWTAWLAVFAALRRRWGFKLVYVCALDGEVDGRFAGGAPWRKALFFAGMRAADARLAITKTMAERLQQRGLSCAGITRLLLAAPPPSRPQVPKSRDLLWAARCHPVKRPQLFLELARRLPAARCRMICAPQDTGLFEAVRARAAALPNLEFVPGVPYAQIQEEFDAAKVFVNTSEDEGMPNTFVQSGLGQAAIASLVSDPDRLIETFGAGVSAKGNFEVLVQGVAALLGSREALVAAAEGAARFVREWHDNSRNVEAFLRALP